MVDQNDNKHLFQASVIWLSEKKGLLTSSEASGSIQVETPPAFGGKGKPWSPENLFLGAVSSCFMTTYLSFAEKFKVRLEGLSCRLSGWIETVKGISRFTRIEVYADVYVSDDLQEKQARMALQKTQRHCLILNSINAEIHYHNNIRLLNDLKEA